MNDDQQPQQASFTVPSNDVPPLKCPDFHDLSQKIYDAIEFCHTLQIRLDNMQHHGTPTAEIYDFTTRQKLN